MTSSGPRADDVDVVIIGAGVAGLAAARNAPRGRRAHRHPGSARPHRRPDPHPARRAHASPHRGGRRVRPWVGAGGRGLAREAGLVICDTLGERWRSDRGKFTPLVDEDFWPARPVMGRLDPQRTPDRSFQDFLDRSPAGRRSRTSARSRASTSRGSTPATSALANAGSRTAEPRRTRMTSARAASSTATTACPPARRAALARSAVARGTGDRVGAGARRGSLPAPPTMGSRPRTIAARAAIVTLPLSVLQQPEGESAITFPPEIVDTRRAGSARDGTVPAGAAVSRAVLGGASVRRKTGGRSLTDLAFLHYRTMTSRSGGRSTGSGGHARRVDRRPKASTSRRARSGEVEARAIAALARLVGMQRHRRVAGRAVLVP